MLVDTSIVTNRFYLRCLLPSDVSEHYVAWFDQEQIRKYIQNQPNSNAKLQDLKKYVAFHNERDDSLLLGIFSKCTDQHIGNIKFEPIKFAHQEVYMGVLIGDPNWRGQNVFGEVFQACKLFLFEKFNIINFMLGVEEANTVAVAAYKKAGFVVLPESKNGISMLMNCTLS